MCVCVFFSIVGKSINDRKRHNLIVLPEKSGKSLAVSTYLNHTWMTCYMFADMRVTFKIKFRSTCHIYNFNRHEMIGVPTHEATNSKNVQPYMSHAKNPVTLAINGNTVAALWKKWHQKTNITTNKQKHTHDVRSPLLTYKWTHHVRSPSHTRPGLKMRTNIPTRGPWGVGCLALPPSSSESMKSNMFEALKREKMFSTVLVDTFSLLVSFFTWGSGFRWYFKISTQTTWEFADERWIWTVHMNFSCSFHFSNSLLLVCNSSLKFTAPLFWKFHQQNSERY